MRSGKMPFKMESVDVAALIRRSVTETEGFASTLNVKLAFAPPHVAYMVNADPDRLMQVVTNLLSNACKFSPAGGSVEVKVETPGAMVRVSVSDRGPGIPAGEERELFERFMQVGAGKSRQVGGTGLGLNICRLIIERLSGKIGYLPRPGGGSVFYFDLPYVAAGSAS
jgi:signal transduction histidine kinase